MRESAAEKLRAFLPAVAWTNSGSKVRVAPEMVGRYYRNGRKQFVQEKEL